MDKLNAMKVFVAVADEQSFTGAANRLGMAKSAVSKYISDLELDLGTGLLNRTTRRLSLTETGQAYRDRCINILAQIEETELEIQNLQVEPRGTLRINAGVSFGINHLAPAITSFMKSWPDIKVELSLADRYVDVIEEGLDLVIRIGQLSDSTLIARKITTSRQALCASPDYLSRYGTPLHPRDLSKHNCLSYSLLRTGNDWALDDNGKPLTVSISGSLLVNNGDVLRIAALDGLGIYNAPTFIVAPDLKTGKLVQVLADFETSPHNIYAVYPPNRHLSAKVRTLVDFLSDWFGPDPVWDSWA